MEKIRYVEEHPLEKELNEFVEKYRQNLNKFIWYQDKVSFKIDDQASTFYFSPKEKLIAIPGNWFREYLEDRENPEHLLTAKLTMAHEMAHFRDMLREKITLGKGSMYDVLKKLSTKKIDLGGGEYIPMGEKIHCFYNCVDDIIVNQEVMNFIPFGLNKEDFHKDYQTSAFADYIPKDWWDFSQSPDWAYVPVEEGKWTHQLNTTEPVDYRNLPADQALSYYFLRDAMVRDQKILLPEDLENILFKEEERKRLKEEKRKRPWKESYTQTLQLLTSEIGNAEKSSDPKIQETYQKLRSALYRQKTKLQASADQQDLISSVCNEIKKSGRWDTSRMNPYTISLYDIIQLLNISKGLDHDHQLCVMPSLRYRLYEGVFEPILETLVLVDALKNGVSDSGNWEGKWEGNWEGNWEWEWEVSWTGTVLYPDIASRLRDLEEAAGYQNQKENEKKGGDTQQNLFSALNNPLISKEEKELSRKIDKNAKSYIQDITNMLYAELSTVDSRFQYEKTPAKSWDLDYPAVVEEISSSYPDVDLSDKEIYKKNRVVEELDDELKKLLFYFVIDVSWSMNGFKGENGLLNIIVTALTYALKNVEQRAQKRLKDPNYSIPIKYVIYTDRVVYSSTNEKDQALSYKEELIKVNSAITREDGGTNDVQWWMQISNCLIEDLKWKENYGEEIKKWERKPVVLQISDSDVTDYGLSALRQQFSSDSDLREILPSLLAKRIILGETIEKTYSEEELKQGGDWSNEYTKGPDGKEVIKDGKKLINVKEVWVRSHEDIIEQVSKIFKNFFTDIKKKKKKK